MNVVVKRLAAALFASAAVVAPAYAFPDRPVTIIVPSGAGSSGDLDARAVANALSRHWGQPVVVENVTGGSGYVGTQRVLQSEPDGYTILAQFSAVVLYRSTIPDVVGDPLDELRMVTMVQRSPYSFIVNAETPVNTLPELVEYCRVEACNWGYANTTGELILRQLQDMSGSDSVALIPYQGSAPVANDVIGNSLTMGLGGVATYLPQVNAGRLKYLAIAGDMPFPTTPDVPTAESQGLPIYAQSWLGFMLDKDVPDDVAAAIYDGIIAVSTDKEVATSIATNGGEPVFNSPEEFAADVQEQAELLNGLREQFPANQ